MRNLGFFFFVFSVIFLLLLVPRIGADELSFVFLGEDFNTDEAKLFPYLCGSFILLISILIIIQHWITKVKTSARHSSKFELRKLKDVGILLAICLLYIILITPLGFILITPFCLVACLWFFGLRKWPGLTIIPVLITVFIFICFEKLMSIELPKGILEWMFY